jgi:hypothetical protein
VTTRIAGRADRFEATVRLLAEFLPLDETRAAEAEVWLAFTVAARTRPLRRDAGTKAPGRSRAAAARHRRLAAALGKPQANAVTPVSPAETVHRRSACAGSIA